jgi:hypothetical protein
MNIANLIWVMLVRDVYHAKTDHVTRTSFLYIEGNTLYRTPSHRILNIMVQELAETFGGNNE